MKVQKISPAYLKWSKNTSISSKREPKTSTCKQPIKKLSALSTRCLKITSSFGIISCNAPAPIRIKLNLSKLKSAILTSTPMSRKSTKNGEQKAKVVSSLWEVPRHMTKPFWPQLYLPSRTDMMFIFTAEIISKVT